MLIVDAHQDLAWNILTFGRDYTLPVAETRRRELGTEVPLHNGDTLLGWSEYQQGRVAIVFGEDAVRITHVTIDAAELFRLAGPAMHVGAQSAQLFLMAPAAGLGQS